jgi:TRAP-type C4-dicarboxylate transport system substrate-binding protein
MNLDKWRTLPKAAQDLLARKSAEFELKFAREAAAQNDLYREDQQKVGVSVVNLSSDVAAKYLKAAYDAGWEEATKLDPINAPKLRKLISKD